MQTSVKHMARRGVSLALLAGLWAPSGSALAMTAYVTNEKGNSI